MFKNLLGVILTLLFLLILGLGVAKIATSYQRSTLVDTSQTALPLQEAATEFYTHYQNCLKPQVNQPEVKTTAYCLKNSQPQSVNLLSNLTKNTKSLDPVLCSLKQPAGFIVGRVSKLTQTSGSVEMNESFGPGNSLKIQALLVKENNLWKVDNIVCP